MLQYYDRIVDEREVCQGQWLLNVSTRLAAAPASLAPTSVEKEGVLGEFTTIGVVDPGYASIQSAVMTNGGKILGLTRDKNMVRGVGTFFVLSLYFLCTFFGKKRKRNKHSVLAMFNLTSESPSSWTSYFLFFLFLPFSSFFLYQKKKQHCRANDPVLSKAFTFNNLNDICNSSIMINGATMKYQHNSSNCGDCFGDVMGFSGMYLLLMVADGYTADMGSTWQTLALVISSGQNLNSAGFFGQATGFNNWKKWSTSVCLLKEMNQMYVNGKITTGMAQTRNGPVDKTLVYGEQIKMC
jgi:hypothetical protein